MADVYCPRCGKAISGGMIICPKCTEELNAIAARRRRTMSLVFTLIVIAIGFLLYREGRLDGVLKSFISLKFLAKTVEEYIFKLF